MASTAASAAPAERTRPPAESEAASERVRLLGRHHHRLFGSAALDLAPRSHARCLRGAPLARDVLADDGRHRRQAGERSENGAE
jgi:hypothetical protein